jgi:hypothetical protein
VNEAWNFKVIRFNGKNINNIIGNGVIIFMKMTSLVYSCSIFHKILIELAISSCFLKNLKFYWEKTAGSTCAASTVSSSGLKG